MSAFPPKQAPLETVALPPLPERPLVSIIVPSFNQGRYIRETIDSILEQNYRPLQIHVIDGASSDETVSVLKSYGEIPELDWVSEPDSGVVDAVNKGFAKVKGEIVAIQSSDDSYLAGAIHSIVKVFQADEPPELGLVYGDTVKVDATGVELQRYRIGPWSLENLFLLKTWIPQPSCFFRRELLEACGGWDERIPYAPDTDLWIRMAFRTKVRKIDEYFSERRIHDAQRDNQAAKILRDYHLMIRNSPDIAMADKSIQRAARAGCELFYGRYNPTGSHWNAVAHELKAAVILPKSISWKRVWYNIVISTRIALKPIKRAVLAGIE